MSHSDQQQAPPVYPPPLMAYPPPGQAYPPPSATYAAPPPAGYPVGSAPPYSQQVPVETNSRGDGFWKGCAAALCCCCVLDMCF